MKFSPEGRVCSFCGCVGSAETKFAGGLGALMCETCLSSYHEIFASQDRLDAVRRPPWESLSDDELLARLPSIEATAAQVQDFLHEWVHLARARRLSWSEIGRALGVSRQSAWERFRRSTPDTEVDVGSDGWPGAAPV